MAISTTYGNALKNYLKRYRIAVALKRYAADRRYELLYGRDGNKGCTRLNILRTFPLFRPNSSGSYQDKANLTIQTLNQTIPCLRALAVSVASRTLQAADIEAFPQSAAEIASANHLKECLDRYGSDKATEHNYHNVYGPILSNREAIRSILEIGLGTNNTDVVSNMGAKGKPGASLRAFRDFLPNATIYGADVDRRILFSDERIDTFHVDQTDASSFTSLREALPDELDLVIDDGLHSPDANIRTLEFGLSKIKKGGWVVIEDIGSHAPPVWEVVASLLPADYQPYLLRADKGIVFAVQRLGDGGDGRGSDKVGSGSRWQRSSGESSDT